MNSAWMGVLMVTLAVILAAGFVVLWMRDKGRSDEEAHDPERMQTDARLDPEAREGAALKPPEQRERRH